MSSWSPSTPSSSIRLVSEQESHLLSQSLPSPDPFDVSSQTHTGPGGADLSLSELSLPDMPFSHDPPCFSLLAPPPAPLHFSADQCTLEGNEYEEEGTDVREDDDADNIMMQHIVAEKAREEKLQSDLIILRKLNASFALLNDALQTTKGATQQVAEQLSQTDALLDKYANMLAKSETVTRLIFDERWRGADADEVTFAREREEVLERTRIEREREKAASREAEERARREAEEIARREAEERAKLEAAAVSKAPPKGRGAGAVSSGVRGVRGTRATATAMASRGARGLSRTASTSTSAIHRTRSASATGSVSSSGGGTRPGSSASRGSGLRGVPRRG